MHYFVTGGTGFGWAPMLRVISVPVTWSPSMIWR